MLIARRRRGVGGLQRLQRDLERASREFLPDIEGSVRHVHLGDGTLALLAPVVKKLAPRRSVSLRLHGLDVVYPNPLYQRILRASLPACDRIVCISRATADEARVRGARDDQIVVIPPGIFPSAAPFQGAAPHGGAVLLTVGRLIPRKGHVWFIENVLPFLPDVRYVIVGSGPEERCIRESVERHGLSDVVTLLTDADDAARDACYREADLFVMPNVPVGGDMEGFGIVALEASVRGVPVVAADLEGVADAVLPETGKLFTPRDPESCADAIRTFLDVMVSLSNHISAATLRAFSWEHLIKRYAHEVFGFPPPTGEGQGEGVLVSSA